MLCICAAHLCSCIVIYLFCMFQGIIEHKFVDFETFNVDEYEHYEVCLNVALYTYSVLRIKYYHTTPYLSFF